MCSEESQWVRAVLLTLISPGGLHEGPLRMGHVAQKELPFDYHLETDPCQDTAYVPVPSYSSQDMSSIRVGFS